MSCLFGTPRSTIKYTSPPRLAGQICGHTGEKGAALRVSRLHAALIIANGHSLILNLEAHIVFSRLPSYDSPSRLASRAKKGIVSLGALI